MYQQQVITAIDAKKGKIDDILKKLSTSTNGISSTEAEVRLQQYGRNLPKIINCISPTEEDVRLIKIINILDFMNFNEMIN